jgi:hypothetical protein
MRTEIPILLALLLTACGDEEAEVVVEPAIVDIVPTDMGHGSFVLTVLLDPDAGDTAEVWLYELTSSNEGGRVIAVSSDVAFPLELEPGELKRVQMQYELSSRGCLHELSGTIFDSLSDEMTTVTSAGAVAPGCKGQEEP